MGPFQPFQTGPQAADPHGYNRTGAGMGHDPVDRYFECITSCSLDDGECVTQCVEVLRSAE